MDPWNYISVCMKSLNIPLPHASSIFDSNISTVDMSLWNTDSNCPLSPVLTVSLNKSLPFLLLLLAVISALVPLQCQRHFKTLYLLPLPPRVLHLFLIQYYCHSLPASVKHWAASLQVPRVCCWAARGISASMGQGKWPCALWWGWVGGFGAIGAPSPWEGRRGQDLPACAQPLAAGSPPMRVCQLCLYHIFVPFNCFG